MRKAHIHRKTKETDIDLTLWFEGEQTVEISTGVPFFDHILYSFAFHGGFSLVIQATGDIEVDPHHLVEDVGLVIGDALQQIFEQSPAIRRFGHFLVPMDDALAETIIDACNRPYLVYNPELPQAYIGTFDVCLIREFLLALCNRARINLHAIIRYGQNSHHMVEALFKSMGKALAQAFELKDGTEASMSTKGSL